MYITYYCDKFEFTVLCRFHIENFTKKAENTLAARYWQFRIFRLLTFLFCLILILRLYRLPGDQRNRKLDLILRSFSTPLIRSIRISTAREAFCSTFWLIVVSLGTENSA